MIAAMIVCATALAETGDNARSDLTRALETQFEPAAQALMEESGTPGLAIAIVIGGEEIYSKAFGVKNVETNEPLDTSDLFHWASVTKPFVATAIVQLVEKGLVDLDAPVVQYVPYFEIDDEASGQITVRQMLTHTSGMPDVLDYEWDNPVYDDDALEQYVRGLKSRRLIFRPGEKFRYSNIAYEILGDLIAKVSGMTFEAYVDTHIFQPLGMDQTTLLITETDADQRTSPHTQSNGKTIVRKHWPYNRIHAPSSTLITNVHDAAKWAAANLNRGILGDTRILQEDSYRLLWEPSVDTTKRVGLSWFRGRKERHDAIYHSGSDRGFQSDVTLIPDLGLGIVVVTNSDNAPRSKFSKLALQASLSAVSEKTSSTDK
jgi:CubicO group peptidase (beta-lactamase class C family)